MLLECDLPMSKETCVPRGGILAYIASTFAEDKNRNHESTSSNMLALSYFLRSKAFWSVFSQMC